MSANERSYIALLFTNAEKKENRARCIYEADWYVHTSKYTKASHERWCNFRERLIDTNIPGDMIWRSQLGSQLILTGRYHMKAIHEWTWKSRHKRTFGSSSWRLAISHSSTTSKHPRQASYVRSCRTSHPHQFWFHKIFARSSQIPWRRRQCLPHQFRNALRSEFAYSECNLKILLFIRFRRYFLTSLGIFSPKNLKPSWWIYLHDPWDLYHLQGIVLALAYSGYILYKCVTLYRDLCNLLRKGLINSDVLINVYT